MSLDEVRTDIGTLSNISFSFRSGTRQDMSELSKLLYIGEVKDNRISTGIPC